MSLKHALLALLVEKPSHGYELKSRFRDAPGPLWPLREAQICNNLQILEREGLVVRVEQDVEGRRGRSLYWRQPSRSFCCPMSRSRSDSNWRSCKGFIPAKRLSPSSSTTVSRSAVCWS